MLVKAFWMTPLLFVTFVQPAGDDKAKKDLALMQGTWTMHALEINGKSEARIAGTTLTIAKDSYKTTVKKKESFGFRIVLDPSKDPKWIDMIKTEADGSELKFKGIYKIENDTFTFVRGAMETQERPSQFGTWPDTGYFMVTWKKQAK